MSDPKVNPKEIQIGRVKWAEFDPFEQKVRGIIETYDDDYELPFSIDGEIAPLQEGQIVKYRKSKNTMIKRADNVESV